jgi:sarcosine oxidase subunit alpha
VTERARFIFEGRTVDAVAGQSIGAALHAQGIRTLSWSAKYRRARGLRCVRGACPCCALRVDGLPGVPACTTPVRGGETVERERPAAARLPLDRLSRFAPAGFYYERLAHSPRLWRRAERVLAHLAGIAQVPAALPLGGYREERVDVLVVGGGRAGLRAACDYASGGSSVLVVERDHEAGGSLLAEPGGRLAAEGLAAAASAAGAKLVLGATVIGLYDDGLIGVVDAGGLLALRAAQVVFATGGHDRELAFPNGDRPGVLLAGGAQRLLVRDGVRPGNVAVTVGVDGHGEHVTNLLRDAGVTIAAECHPADVIAAHGRHAVQAVTLRAGRGERRIACDTVIVALGRRPADELKRQHDEWISAPARYDVV